MGMDQQGPPLSEALSHLMGVVATLEATEAELSMKLLGGPPPTGQPNSSVGGPSGAVAVMYAALQRLGSVADRLRMLNERT